MPGPAQAVDAQVRPGAGDVAVDDEGAGRHVEHDVSVPSSGDRLVPAALHPVGALLLLGPPASQPALRYFLEVGVDLHVVGGRGHGLLAGVEPRAAPSPRTAD